MAASMARIIRAGLKARPLASSRPVEDPVQAKTDGGHQLMSTISERCGDFLSVGFAAAYLFLVVGYANYLDYISKLEREEKNDRRRLEELIKSRVIESGSNPSFSVALKGKEGTVKFSIPPTCEIPHLVANIVSHGAASDVRLHASDSSVAWKLTLSDPDDQKNSTEGNLRILISHSLTSSDKAECEFIKHGSFTDWELNALNSVLQIAGETTGGNKVVGRKKEELAGKTQSSGETTGGNKVVGSKKEEVAEKTPSAGETTGGNKVVGSKKEEVAEKTPTADKLASSLEALGVRVYGVDGEHVGFSGHEVSWGSIAGYEQEKRVIEDTVLLALHNPKVYDDITHRTRSKFESNRPRAVLFEGPPGTGKTSCARVIAGQAGVPLLYVPLEAIISKWYGETESTVGKIFSLANEFPNGAIIFLDEVESLAGSREDRMHESTRRILSVLLRQIDGFEQDKKVLVIAATNRKQDLDPALLSRFDSIIKFDLPDQKTREAMASQYAKHLTKSELQEFTRATGGMSGRDMRDVCKKAERHWASKIIRGQAPKDGEGTGLPPIEVYIESAKYRQIAKQTKANRSSVEALGVRFYGVDKEHVGFSGHEVSWGNIAGYEQEKRVIEDTVLLALHNPEVYDDISRGTRSTFESNRPRAVLFEGPPGTGKTSCARVIAGQAGIPLLYVPLEAIMSKWYGENTRNLGNVFSLAKQFPNGAIVFLDEVDSLAPSRDGKIMHESTRRLMSVLLREMDGFEQDKKVLVIAATNRKQDLDPALLSRFDSIIKFDLPDQKTREAMAAQYAKHLTKSELQEFTRATEGMSGRDMRDVCQQAERHWASKIIRGQVPKQGEGTGAPPIEVYVESAKYRRMAMQTNEPNPSRNPN